MKTKTAALAMTLSVLCLSSASAQIAQVNVVTDQSMKGIALAGLKKRFIAVVGAGQVKQCPLILQEDFGRGFAAFGGSCDVELSGKTKSWMICYDTGVGNFAAVIGARWWQDPQGYLAQFTQANCVGG